MTNELARRDFLRGSLAVAGAAADREGNYLGYFPPGTSAERMAEIIRPHLGAPVR